MKSSSLIKYGAVILLIATAIACKPKGSDGASVNARDPRTEGPNLMPTGQGSPGATANMQLAANSKENVQILMAGALDPAAIGEIKSIEVLANIGVQANGAVTTDSALQLIIKDDFVVQSEDGSTIEPISIRIGNATGTAINGQVNITFSDSYGQIVLTGNFVNGGNFTGSVAFKNTKSSFNNKQTGTLGTFTQATCSIFRCAK